MTNTPNKYQQKILDWVINGNGNALVEARAGCGKTATLLMIAETVNDIMKQKCLFVAFNKHIADEMTEKLGSRISKEQVLVSTVNALGLKFIRSDLARKYLNSATPFQLVTDNFKMFNIVKNIVAQDQDKLPSSVDEAELNEICFHIQTLCDLVRETLVPYAEQESIDRLILRYGVFNDCKTYGLNIYDIVQKAMEEDLRVYTDPIATYPITDSKKAWGLNIEKSVDGQVFTHYIDLVDQIYLPIRLRMSTPKSIRNNFTSFILCDEAQDLSNTQQRLLQSMSSVPKQSFYNPDPAIPPRYIFVADEQQAIYGFAGADTHSIEHLKEKFTLNYFPLNICYRCPKNHINLIQTIVPDIECNPNAEKGEIHIIYNEDIAKYVKGGDYIIARKNKDLVTIMIDILQQGKSIYIKDENLVRNTISNIKKQRCKTLDSLRAKILDLQTEFQKQQKDPTLRVAGSVISNESADIYDTILTLLEFYQDRSKFKEKTVKSFIDYITDTLKTKIDKSSIILSSVHSVKGGEADNVFIISYNQFPYLDPRNTIDQNIQENNLQYIAVSRAKKKLFLCIDDNKNINDYSEWETVNT